MKKFLIFLSIAVVIMLAGIDAKDRMNELEKVAVKTPAQVEMNKDMLKPTRNNNTQDIKKQPANTSFNERLKEQQNNNLPQTKQPQPLDN